MDYKFVVIREAGWAAFIAIATLLLQELATFNEAVLDDPVTWVIGVGLALLRAGAAAVLAAFTKGFVLKEPSPANPQG